MEERNEKICLWCLDVISYRVGDLANLETHLRITHEMKENVRIGLSILFHSPEELDEMQTRLEPRMQALRAPSKSKVLKEEIEARELKAIQESLLEQLEGSDSETENDKEENPREDITDKETVGPTFGRPLVIKQEPGLETEQRQEPPQLAHETEQSQEQSRNTEADTDVCTKTEKDQGESKDAEVVDSGVDTEDSRLKDINLAEKFEQFNTCKLCYAPLGSKEKLRRHEENVHKDDQRELAITSFTISDLVFPCDRCPSVRFLSENILNKHRNALHKIPFSSMTSTCQVCSKVVRYYSLKSHEETHRQEKNYSCSLCYRAFSVEKYLRAHQKKIHQDHAEYLNRDLTEEDLKFDCQSCNKKFVAEDILEYHKARTHTEHPEKTSRVSLKCYFCKERFTNGIDRNAHCLKAHGKKDEPVGGGKVKCMICQKVVGKTKISTHKQKHVRFVKYECPLCYSKFSAPGNRRVHIRNIHRSEEEKEYLADRNPDKLKYECDWCSLKFLTVKLLQNHKQKDHGSTKIKKLKGLKIKKEPVSSASTLKCKLCYRIFVSRRNLRIHCEKVHGDGEEKQFLEGEITEADLIYPCAECSKRFVTNSLLEKHSKRHVVEAERKTGQPGHLKCYFCDETFKLGVTRNKHCYSKHGKKDEPIGETMVKCMVCDKIVSRVTIKNHKTIHTERKFSCKLCYFKFRSNADRNIHARKVHRSEEENTFLSGNQDQGQFNFKCRVCDLTFLTEKLQSSHERTHKIKNKIRPKSSLSKNPHRCKLCYKKFKNVADHHKKVHTSDEEKKFLEAGILEADLKYPCSECPRKFVTESLMQKHSKKHTAEEYEFVKEACYIESLSEYRCILCYTQYKYLGSMIDHAAGYHKDEIDKFKNKPDFCDLKIDCPDCQLKFVSTNSATFHRLKSHLMDETNTCKLCDLKFRSAQGTFTHKLRIHGEELEILKLNQPPENYKRKSVQKSKSAGKIQIIGVKNKKCVLCFKDFSSLGNLNHHKRRVHGKELHFFEKEITEEDLHYKCADCEARFVSRTSLKSHQSKHFQIQKCFFCDEGFTSRRDFTKHCWKVHQKRDEDIEGGFVKCMVCSKEVSKKRLSIHRNSHSEIRKYSCKLCYKKFKQREYLYGHLRNVHQTPEEKAFLKNGDESDLIHGCDSCERKFLTAKLLAVHVSREHSQKTAIRPVLSAGSNIKASSYCNLCYHEYSSSSNLRQHRLRVHTTEEEMKTFDAPEIDPDQLQYSCTQCDKKFLTEKILQYHTQYRHRDEKKEDVSCEYCGRAFSWKNRRNLKTHIRDVHKVQDFTLDELSNSSTSREYKKTDTVSNFMSFLSSLEQ